VYASVVSGPKLFRVFLSEFEGVSNRWQTPFC